MIHPALPSIAASLGAWIGADVHSCAPGVPVVQPLHRDRLIGSGGRERSDSPDLVRRAEEEVGERDRVHTEVEERAATVVDVVEPVGRVECEAEPELVAHTAHVANLTVGDELLRLADQRVDAGPHRLHREHSGARRGIEDLPCVSRVEAHGLLDEHRLACLDRHERLRLVARVGGRDVHHVDLAVIDESPVVAVASGSPVLGGEPSGALGVSGGHGGDHAAGAEVDVVAHGVRDAAGAKDSPANRTVSGDRYRHDGPFDRNGLSSDAGSPRPRGRSRKALA